MKILILKAIKESFKNIKKWGKMNDADFTNKIKNSLYIKDQKIQEMVNIHTLEIEYIVSKNNIFYSGSTTMYDVDEKSLLETALDNDYKVMNFPESFTFEDSIILIKKIYDTVHSQEEHNIRIIPLEDKLLIKYHEDIEVQYGNLILKTEEI